MVQLSIAEYVYRLGLMWRTVIESYDFMRKDITCRHQTETVVVMLFNLCNQAAINCDAELKKTHDERVMQVSLWLSGEDRGGPAVTRLSPALI